MQNKEKILGSQIYQFMLYLSLSIIVVGYILLIISEFTGIHFTIHNFLWSISIIILLSAPATLLLTVSIIMLKKKEKRIFGLAGLLGLAILLTVIIVYLT